jgi:hypothetical protein
MLVIKVELHSAIDGRIEQLANMVIANDGTGTSTKGNYWGKAFRKGSDYFSERGKSDPTNKVIAQGKVDNYPRKDKHVWNLIARMLRSMAYG